ncbi:MbcA/ParS/Xre antitoxin family protein [Pseudomonas helleri]|uniref:MbcA/ParS/Xre antitoxin family protein n=1 Tax=Pseudomonas helleri TaxID=1608996 RepID=UPI003FD027DF
MCQQALLVFESRETVAIWMSVPNAASGHSAPELLCVTEIGAQRVSRVLNALEGGV